MVLTQVSRVLLMDEGEAEELQGERTFEKESSMSNGEKAGRTKEAGETLGLLGMTGIQSCLGLQSNGLGRVWHVWCRQTEKILFAPLTLRGPGLPKR